MSRQIWVVDVESTSLDPDAAPLEIAAVNIDTGEEFRAVPHIAQAQLSKADPDSLRVNRYYERGVFKDMLETVEANKNIFDWLKNILQDQTLAGSNPSFDAGILSRQIATGGLLGTPWHHRLLDLSAYAMGVLGLEELPGLAKVCELVGVTNDDPHSALGDARATAECFRRLREWADQNRVR
ncbi:DnaQ-like exonuclease [Mycobacterium phage Gaia]|uniref:DnaQ-like exonuclease n=1 Tax=Mycobacterium phage Gaia TaxID=1486472 RepID=A0A068F3L1_9CAUD|nr:DNA polymerase exonuclease subunit [Mycobacterium phage Gaia]AID58938.1 DnaQ-like exonuclease [Mycobacterium phage Gaia]AYR00056.1 DnaQ-like exonuclease [Mycobacterium phage Nebkiss]